MLQAATEILSRARTPEEVAQSLVGECSRGVGAAGGAVVTVSEDGARMGVVRTAEVDPSVTEPWRDVPVDGAPSPTRDLLRTGQGVFLPDRRAWADRYPHLVGEFDVAGTRAAAYVPLRIGERILGALALRFTGERPFPPEERELLLTLGMLGAHGLERSRLLQETDAARWEAERVAERLRRQVAETERATRALQESEDRFRTLADSIPQLAWMTDAEGWIFWYNRRWYEYTGATLPEMEGWGWTKVHHPDHVDRVVERFRGAVAAGESWEDTFPLRRRDGVWRWFLSRALPIRDPEGEVVMWFGTNTDVTEQLRGAREREGLLQAEREARSLAESARRDAERVADRITRLQRVTGAISAAATVERVAAVVVEEGVDALGADLAALFRLEPSGEELELVAGHGLSDDLERAWRSLPVGSATPMAEAARLRRAVYASGEKDADHAYAALPLLQGGDVLGTLSFSFRGPRVISGDEHAFLETLATQATQALDRARLYEAERQARGQAERANRAKAQFLSVMSHELRTPLNAVLGYADLLVEELKGPLNGAQRVQVGRIKASALHQLSLIEEILAYTRLDAGREELHSLPCDLGRIIRDVAELVKPQAGRKALELRLEAPDGGLSAVTDPGRVRQVALNLAGNAVKFTDRGCVTLALRGDGDDVAVLEVRDTGPGIEPGQRELIFEPFTQVDQSPTRRNEGTGLGLAISRRLAELLGGSIELESVVGEGSTFRLRIPRQPPHG